MTRFLTLKTVGVLAMAFAFWALPARAMAIPAVCGGGVDVTTYTEGCTVDGLLFSEFAVVDAGSDTVLVNAVLAQLVGGTVFFTFNPNLTGPGVDDIHFFFKVSTLDGSANIVGVDLENLGIGNTSIQESLCTVSWLTGGFGCVGKGGSLIGTGLLALSGQFDNDFFAARSSAYVFKDIFKGEGGHLTAFTQSFHVPDGGSTLALLGLGLLGLRTVRRKLGQR